MELKNFGQRCRWLLLGRESQFVYNHVLALNLGGLDYFLALKTPTKKNNLEIFLFVSIEMNLFYGLENKIEGITMIMHFFFLHYWI